MAFDARWSPRSGVRGRQVLRLVLRRLPLAPPHHVLAVRGQSSQDPQRRSETLVGAMSDVRCPMCACVRACAR
eukprot:11768746-Alexandrium_andersonii.AAC.1